MMEMVRAVEVAGREVVAMATMAVEKANEVAARALAVAVAVAARAMVVRVEAWVAAWVVKAVPAQTPRQSISPDLAR